MFLFAHRESDKMCDWSSAGEQIMKEVPASPEREMPPAISVGFGLGLDAKNQRFERVQGRPSNGKDPLQEGILL
jgi:hypothetical protein